jgi:mono/diheme cytochrome c family protein
MNRRSSLVILALGPLTIACLRSDGLIGDLEGQAADAAASPSSNAVMPASTGSTADAAAPSGPPQGGGAPAPGLATTGMPQDVLALLQGRCAGCHTYGQADPAGWGSVMDVSRMIDADIVVPGDPNASRMIDRVAVAGDMPPKGTRLTSEEVKVLKGWIAAMRRPASTFQSDTDVLDAIAADQLRLRDRSSDYRYVSFAHFAGEGRSAEELDATRKVFVFVLNSLSRRGAIVDAPTIDAQKSIHRVRLSDLGWDEALWDTLTGFYPYCVRSDAAAHEALYAQLRTEAPYVRGDWFLATATKPPLYDLLVNSPRTLDELAARLGVNIDDDINHPGKAEPDNLTRVGFRRSGVALNNRLLERHLGAQGQALWISYDFDSNQGRSDLMANPLGPAARDRQNFVHTFEHAGGEVIYTMPNGLQGYMLVNAVGLRLDVAPLTIVRDPRRRTSVVENGISCFGCHGTAGILRPRDTDEVPRYTDTHIAAFLGRELNEIEASYPRVLRPDPFLGDSKRYRAFADGVEGGGPPAGGGEYGDFVALVGQYESNVGFHGAAAEFSEEYGSLHDRVLANDFQNIALPRTATAPLVTRDNFVCVFRDLVTKIRRNAVFCAKTFDAAAVRNTCSGSTATPPASTPPSDNGGNGGNRRDASAAPEPSRDAGAPADARTDGPCRLVRVNGRSVCR